MASPEIRETTDELRSEEKEEKEAHLERGNNMCKDPVAGRSAASLGESQGAWSSVSRGRKRDSESSVSTAEAPGR